MFPSTLAALITSVVVTQVAIFTTTIYLHRALSHKSVTLSPGVTWFFRIVTWVTTGLRPRQWVAVHRLHHAKSDEEGDPHSPRIFGFLKVQLGNAVLYRRAAAREEVVSRYAKDLPSDRWDTRFLDHALLGLGLGLATLMVLFGPVNGLIAGGVHAASYLLLSGAVNAVGHLWGRRPHDNFAGNSQWLAFLTAGEGLHNNHHAVPTAGRLAFARGEIDPGWWVIRFLRWRGWAEVRLSQDAVAARAT